MFFAFFPIFKSAHLSNNIETISMNNQMRPGQRIKKGLTHAGESKEQMIFFYLFFKIQLKDLSYFINRSFSLKFITHIVWIEWIDADSNIDRYW